MKMNSTIHQNSTYNRNLRVCYIQSTMHSMSPSMQLSIPQIDKPHLTNAQKVGGRLVEKPQIFLKFNLDCRFNVVRQKKTNE